jgi:predicted HicB family RNase H-like nuclease
MSKTRKPHYQKVVYWSDEDGCFVGQCPALFLGGCHGDDEAAVYRELCCLVEEHLEILGQDGCPVPPQGSAQDFSGKLTLRIDPGLHRALALRAAAERDSLNHAIERRLAASLAE